jgi:EAL domain-containing protein (putative c-di-GMP-specific phosphodiesterase class I)
LRRAIDRKEFSVFYQPIICVKTQKLVGFESLARWKHPEQGYVSPTQFIPLAEDSGMIVSIGDWVFENVCLQIIDWKARGVVKNNFYVSINVSVRQLHQPDFVTNIKQVLRKSGLDPEFVRIEITETVLLDESEVVLANLEALKRLNLPLYLDDFGTGYASLSLLRKLDIEKLKIDQSFVKQLENDGESREIVQGVIGLSHNLGIDVIAEGVETLEVFQKLKELGCDYVQGYYFSKPVNSDEAEALIRKNA